MGKEKSPKLHPYERDVRDFIKENPGKLGEYSTLTPKEKFTAWCRWNGIIGLASVLIDVLVWAGFDVKEKGKE